MSTATERGARHFALVGTPNSGKTALFNALTGGRQKVANYPGVTVERKAGVIQTPAGHRVNLIDLPGTYSLRGRSPDEEITRDVVLGRFASEPRPDLLLCVADATNLRVALRLLAIRLLAERRLAEPAVQHRHDALGQPMRLLHLPVADGRARTVRREHEDDAAGARRCSSGAEARGRGAGRAPRPTR